MARPIVTEPTQDTIVTLSTPSACDVSRPSLIHRLQPWLPASSTADAKERWRSVLGVMLGLWGVAWLSQGLADQVGHALWLVAPLGASAVIVFALPASPMAQPWAVVGGSMISALIGLLLTRSGIGMAWAVGVVVAASVLAMFVLRCLHPPAGALALWVVLTHTQAFDFLLFPLLFNLVLLVLVAVVYNSLTGRPYPHVAETLTTKPQPSRFSAADLDSALAHYNQVLDVSRDELEKLLAYAEAAAYQRNLGELRCVDIMSAQPIAVSYDTVIEEAWTLMRAKSIKALPVVDKSNQIIGIVTLADFVRHMDAKADMPVVSPDLAHRVATIMTRRVRVVSAQLHVVALLPLFSEGGHHHIPVVNEQQQLVGIITQSDLIRALNRAVQPVALEPLS